LQRLEPKLKAFGISVVLPTPEALARRTKDQLPKLARLADIATPETIAVNDHAALRAAAVQLGYPLVVKGVFYEAEIAAGPAEAAAAFDKLSAKWGVPIIAQKFIKGEEFDVIALGDGEGNTHGP